MNHQPVFTSIFSATMSDSNITVVRPQDIDISRVIFTKLRKNKQGKFTSYLNYNGGACVFETPTLHTFGVSRFEDKANPAIKGKFSLTFTQRPGGADTQETVDRFFDFMKAIDEKIIDFMIENSQQILGEQYGPEDRKVVAGMYKKNRLIKTPKLDKEKNPYPCAFKAGFYTRGDEREGEVVVPNVGLMKGKSMVEVATFEELCEAVPKNSNVRAILVPKMYFISGMCGLKWSVQFMKVPEVKKMSMPKTFTFSDEDAGAGAGEGEAAAEGTTEEVVEDDEAEEEEEGEFEEVEE